MDTATLMIWYLCYNNQLYHYTWLDTTISMLWHRYSNLAFYFRNNWLSKLPYDLMILLIKFNTLLYYNWCSNLVDMILLLQQPTISLYMTWYNNLYSIILDTTTNILLWWYLIQRSIYYDNWYSNLTYYYTIMIQQALLCPYDTLDTKH